MNQEQVQQLIDMAQTGVTKMAESMGIAVPELWRILIKQQYVEAVGNFILAFIGMVCFYALYKIARWVVKNPDTSDGLILAIMMGGMMLAVLGVMGLFGLYEGIAHMINPEYYAIKDIVEFIKPINN